jgi:2-iminobutanoate/2-iminopropanoate deaminase
MPKEPISTSGAPKPAGAYSQAIAAGELVFLAGQGPFQTFRNLAAVAEAAGASLADAVRVGVFLRDMQNFPAMNEIYREFFAEPLPARTTIQSDLPGFEIEVDAVLLRER